MKTQLLLNLFILFATLFPAGQALAQSKEKVYVLELRDEVHQSSARYISRGFEEARAHKASLVIIHLDTYGGRVDFADSIRADILNAGIPTAVFIDRNAGSAGALISIACDSIYMAPGASIGAATVVDGNTKEAAPDKYQSYWRAVMRTTAELKGRDPRIAEKMVDEKLDLPGISPAGQVITFSTQEAMEHNYCDGQKRTVQEVADEFGLGDAEIVQYTGSSVDRAINFLIRPGISAFLLLLIFGGIFLEIKTPGFGFPGILAIIGILLFFAPHYVEGLAESWEIALFVLGVGMVVVEIFVIPGFGVVGIAGIVLAVLGIGAALLANRGISFEYVSVGDMLRSVAMVLVMLSTAILVAIWAARHLATSRAAYPYVDLFTQDRELGYTALNKNLNQYVGREAEAYTDLRPSGFILIDGAQLDAEAEEGYITKGQRVTVSRIRSTNLVVKKA